MDAKHLYNTFCFINVAIMLYKQPILFCLHYKTRPVSSVGVCKACFRPEASLGDYGEF